jgi:GTP-binding protein EngB required for normal cell division
MTDLHGAVGALDAIAELGPGRLPPELVAEAARRRASIDERLALGDGLTVVAVVGGTGVGKSALVNRLVGAPVATEGVRRPTTSWPVAVLPPGDAPTSALLDWLGIDERVTAPASFPEGLVLLDLPDHDSVVARHRQTAARLSGRVDGLLVVVDPIKYARADLYDGPLAALTDHAEVVTVVLNRIDELQPDDVERCVADLTERLDGRAFELVTTSASTGEGIERLRARLQELAASRTAARRRLVGDVSALARRAIDELADVTDPVPDAARLREALMDATDAHRVVAEAETTYRRDARRGVRSPLGRLVLLPVRGVGGVARSFGIGDPKPAKDASHPSVARIETVLAGELRLQRTTGATHAMLGATIAELAARGAPALADAVGRVGVRPEPRRWWPVMAAIRGIVEAVALVGFVWLVLLGLAEWLQLPDIPTPELTGALTWPTALLLGGLLVRVLIGMLTRMVVSVGARRHRDRVARRIRSELDAATEQRLLTPYRDEVDRHARLRAALHGAANAAPAHARHGTAVRPARRTGGS